MKVFATLDLIVWMLVFAKWVNDLCLEVMILVFGLFVCILLFLVQIHSLMELICIN